MDPQPMDHEKPVLLMGDVWHSSGLAHVTPYRAGQRLIENGVTLEILRITAERLQWITEDGALCEGVVHGPKGTYECGVLGRDGLSECLFHSTARGAFEHRWDWSHPRKFSWTKNPWVWVVQFREVKCTPRLKRWT
jgi:hypothetical protein